MKVTWFCVVFCGALLIDQSHGQPLKLPCQMLDIIFALDQTQSIGHEYSEKMKNFTKELMDRFFVSPDNTRLGLVKFGKRAEYVNNLKLSRRKSGRQHQVLKLIDSMHDLDNITNLHEGLKMAFKQHKKYDEFQTRRRQRQDAKNIVFVLTDGKTHDLSAMKSLLRPPYVTAVIAVLLGPMVSEKSTEVLAHLATKIIHWTKVDGTERDKQKVMNEIMENFDFEPCESKIPDIPKAKKFGCFAKTTDRGLEALNSLESDKCFLIDDDGSLTREDAFEKCAWLAFKRGYRVFGLDGNNTCSSGHLLWRFYKGGFEADCKDKAGGYGSNIVYYFKETLLPVIYGRIGCLRKRATSLTAIDGKMVQRMPGEKFAEKCAWAARLKRDHVITVTFGKKRKCASSNFTGPGKRVFKPVDQRECTDPSAHRRLIFVAAGPCVPRMMDVGIMVDLMEKNIRFLVSLVHSLALADKDNHFGVIASSGDILVRFNDIAGSEDKEALLRNVQNASKNATYSADYKLSLKRVEELFTTANGDRETEPNILLLAMDKIKDLDVNLADEMINNLATQFQGIIFVGFDDFENKKMPEIIEGQVNSHKHITAAFVINTRYPQEVGRRYYGKKLDDIITAICRAGKGEI